MGCGLAPAPSSVKGSHPPSPSLQQPVSENANMRRFQSGWQVQAGVWDPLSVSEPLGLRGWWSSSPPSPETLLGSTQHGSPGMETGHRSQPGPRSLLASSCSRILGLLLLRPTWPGRCPTGPAWTPGLAQPRATWGQIWLCLAPRPELRSAEPRGDHWRGPRRRRLSLSRTKRLSAGGPGCLCPWHLGRKGSYGHPSGDQRG